MGKASAPPAPDYTAAAKETAQGNREAAEYTTKANRINQYTPYGELTYDYKPVLDENGKETGAGWSQRMNLTPEAQAALDQQLSLNKKYGETANIGFDRARSLFENPQLNTSGLPELQGIDPSRLAQAPINAGTTAQQAIMSRLQPQLAQQEEALRTRLANQGITLGSDAYGREMTQQGQQANDLQLQAAMQGIGLDQQARAQGLAEQQAIYGQSADQRGRMMQEQAYMQDRPLNLINALRSGNQVNAPQFQQFAQQANVAGPDLLNAQNMNYQNQLANYNAGQANQSGAMSGLFGIGGAALGGLYGGPQGAMLGAQLGSGAGAAFSDIRLKTNIRRIGTHKLGVGVYEYDYLWGGGKQVGVMAQEVEQIKPEAVFEVGGFKGVYYGKL